MKTAVHDDDGMVCQQNGNYLMGLFISIQRGHRPVLPGDGIGHVPCRKFEDLVRGSFLLMH